MKLLLRSDDKKVIYFKFLAYSFSSKPRATTLPFTSIKGRLITLFFSFISAMAEDSFVIFALVSSSSWRHVMPFLFTSDSHPTCLHQLLSYVSEMPAVL